MRKFILAFCLVLGLAPSAFAQVYSTPQSVSPVQPYEGIATTNNEVLNATSSGNTWIYGRTTEFLRTPATSLTVYVPGCFVNANRTETCLTGTTTVGSSVELPSGTILPCNGGVTTTFVATTGYMVGLSCPAVNGKFGDKFFIRTFLSNPAGIVYSAPAQANAYLASNGVMYGTGTAPSLLNSGSITDQSGNESQGFPPIMVTTPAMVNSGVCGLGDSKMQGEYDAVSDQSGDRGYSRIWGPSFGYVDMGIGGSTGANFVANAHPMEDLVISKCTIVDDEFGINDGGSASSIATMRTAVAALNPTKRTYGQSIGPSTSSVDNYTTTAGQTPAAIVGTFNALERVGISGELGIVDTERAIDQLQLNVYCVAPNPFATTGTANYCTGPGAGAGLHENSTSYAIERDYLAGIVALKFANGN